MGAAGRLRDPVTFQRLASGTDAIGNMKTGAWANILSSPDYEWAEFRPERGQEKIAAGRLQSSTAGTLRVRKSSRTTGITTADSVVIDNMRWEIHDIYDPDRRGQYLEMMIERGASIETI